MYMCIYVCSRAQRIRAHDLSGISNNDYGFIATTLMQIFGNATEYSLCAVRVNIGVRYVYPRVVYSKELSLGSQPLET